MEEEIVVIEDNNIEEINIEEENYSEKPYKLPIASKDVLGGIKVGKNLTIEEDGTLNAIGEISGDIDLTDYAKKSEVPTKTSQLENDSNFINSIKTINGQSLEGEGDIVIEGGSGKSSLEIYSTEETLVGVYKNKPLYRKIVDYGTLNDKAGSLAKPHGISDIDKIVNINAIGFSGDYTFNIDHVANSYMFGTNHYSVRANKTQIELYVSGDCSTQTAMVTMEYTKTTDAEGVIVEPSEVVFVEEKDPTVPNHVKAITQEDIDKWNSGTGSSEINIVGNITTNNNSRLKDKDLNVTSISHRGYNTIAPENTLPAFVLAKEKGYNYVECDVSFTSDGIPVLLHDDTIDRTSNGSGSVSSLTYNQLLQYDFGSWKSSEYAGTKIPTFEEFIVLCKNIGLHPNIELKDNGNYTQEQILEIVDIVKKCGMKGNVTYVSFNINYLNYVKAYDKQARLGYVMFDITQDKINEALNLKSGLNDVFITASYTNLTQEKIELCIANSLPLEMWSVNDESVIKNMNSYISGVTSDSLIASQILSSSNGVEITEVPEHVKKITKLDIAKWNSASGDGSSLEIYSTEEIVIGTWIDLKPIYRKVFSIDNSVISGNGAMILTNILDCDVMVSQKILWFDSYGMNWREFPGNYYGTNDWDAQSYFQTQPGRIVFELGTTIATRMKEKATSIYAILEYTKTTD